MSIDYLKTQVPDILEIFRGQGLESKTATEWAGPCPKCGGDDRFIVWPAEGKFHCLRGCGWKGDAIDAMCWREGVDLSGLFKLYCGRNGKRHKEYHARQKKSFKNSPKEEAKLFPEEIQLIWSEILSRHLNTREQVILNYYLNTKRKIDIKAYVDANNISLDWYSLNSTELRRTVLIA